MTLVRIAAAALLAAQTYPAELAAMIREGVAKYAKIVKMAGVTAQ